jgi:hypothetical protein
MSTWFSEIANSHKLQLGLTAVASCSLGVAAVIGLQQARRKYDVSDLKSSIPDASEPHSVERVCLPSRQITFHSRAIEDEAD